MPAHHLAMCFMLLCTYLHEIVSKQMQMHMRMSYIYIRTYVHVCMYAGIINAVDAELGLSD